MLNQHIDIIKTWINWIFFKEKKSEKYELLKSINFI